MTELDKIIEKILINHSEIIVGTEREYYKFGDIEITVGQSSNHITLFAYDDSTDKNINLATKKYKKLIDGLAKVSKDVYVKNNTYYITLNDSIDINDTTNKIIGYCRVSTKIQLEGNSLEQQRNEILERYPTALIKEEQFSGAKDRDIFNGVISFLNTGDTLVITKLDRFCRTAKEGLAYIDKLMAKGIRIHILNMGLIEDTAMGRLIVTNLLAFAEFERAMIIERTQSGKAIAKLKGNYKDGRPKIYSKKQLDYALGLLNINGGGHSYKEVTEIIGISKSTLIREVRKRKMEFTSLKR